MSLFVYPYKASSRSAIAISDALDCYRINRENSRFAYGADKVVINWGWGNSLPNEVARCKVINKPEAVSLAINKIESFKCFVRDRVRCPDFTTDKTTAQQWLNQGHKVYARQAAEGSDGSGLTVYNSREELPSARLYTKGLHIRNEYRVHVVGDEVVTYQKKVPQSDFTGTRNNDVRTTSNGWGFDVVEDERLVPGNIDDECILAIKSLGLDFGGVDVVDCDGVAYIVEVNTAPHLTPYSSAKLATALKEYIG